MVRKVLRSGATEFRYERQHQPKPKIGPWQVQLDALLDGNDAKPKRERLTLVRIYEELRGLPFAQAGGLLRVILLKMLYDTGSSWCPKSENHFLPFHSPSRINRRPTSPQYQARLNLFEAGSLRASVCDWLVAPEISSTKPAMSSGNMSPRQATC